MNSTSLDIIHMQHALRLAESARYRTSPNPRVGCVLIKAGEVIGEGATHAAGSDHAEVTAIKNSAARGYSLNQIQGATAYVTLEPCNHIGRTGACSQALIAAGVQRIVAALHDPNPLTAGKGFATLQAAGIEVVIMNINDSNFSPLVAQASALNQGFFKRMTTGLPWVRLKVASSLDGYVALPNGSSQWLTGEAARTDTHHWRASACAIITGIGTVLADDPLLSVRHVATPRQPLRVILDTHLRTPVTAKLLTNKSPDSSPVLIVHACENTLKQAALEAAGAELLSINSTGNSNSLNLHAVIAALGARGLNELHFEAGSVLNGALLDTGIVDEVMLYQAPLLLGAGLPWARLAGQYQDLSSIPRLSLQSTTQLGNDVRLVLHTEHTWQPSL